MKNKPLLIKNAWLCDKQTNEKKDVLIESGVVSCVDNNISKIKDSQVIHGDHLVLMPAFIDLHAHFREPGYTYKEDIITGSQAAIKGGYTTVNLMANTFPVCNGDQVVENNLNKAKKADLIDIFQTCSITKDFDGIDCDHIEEITSKGCKIISDDGIGVESDSVMKSAMKKARKKGLIISSHAEYKNISKVDTRRSENLMTQRDINLCEETNAHLHLAHVSTKEAVKMISNAKAKGANLTCECTPHHLALTNSTPYLVHPPLRTQTDIAALIQGINDQTIDCIATDHAPHSPKDKMNGSPGISGIELAFSICYTNLVKTGKISLMKLSELMSFNPSQILGLNKGLIRKGVKADLVLIDLSEQFIVNPSTFYSKGKNTPFSGKSLAGIIKTVIKEGIIKYDDQQIVERR